MCSAGANWQGALPAQIQDMVGRVEALVSGPFAAPSLAFEEVSQRDWVRRLRASTPDPVANPPIKLLDFFASKYDTDQPRQSLAYATDVAQSFSLALQNAGIIDQALVGKIIAYLKTECWLSDSSSSCQPVAIIIGGPCGTGKTTVASTIADISSLPLIEGDDLHSQDCRKRMGQASALDDADRLIWLSRIQGAIMDRVASSKSQGVVVTCSALKVSYRDTLRALKDIAGIRTVFIMLTTGSRDVLKDRMAKRQGHYMKEEIIDNQVERLEPAADHESDVAFVDAGRELSNVFDDIQGIVDNVLV